jgi:trypsin
VRKSLKGTGKLKAVGVALVALAAVGALAASALAVVNGSPDNGKHPYVGVALWAPTGNPADGSVLCSGSLVSATVFVTAAHCFPEGAHVMVDTADDIAGDLNGQQAKLGMGMAHPDPNFGPVGNGLSGSERNDVAVVTLLGPGLPQSGGYAKLPALGYDDTLRNNQQVDIVGYGLPNAGFRMIAPAKIIPGGGKTASEFLKISSSPGHGGATCNGDSGGPDLQAGTDVMLAISSYGPSASCTAVEYSQRMDTPEALAFVSAFMPAQ